MKNEIRRINRNRRKFDRKKKVTSSGRYDTDAEMVQGSNMPMQIPPLITCKFNSSHFADCVFCFRLRKFRPISGGPSSDHMRTIDQIDRPLKNPESA